MAVYTHGHHESVLRSHRWRTAENSAAYLLPHLRPDQSLLDVGAGPDTITADLARHVAQVTATEVGPDELALTRATVHERGAANVDFAVADVHALHFPDDTFDVTHAHQVLQHVGDPVQSLREMARVTRPAGLTDVTATSSTWCFATPTDRDWWGGMWADRILESVMARQLVDSGLATLADLRRISVAWRTWAEAEDGWFSILHGEVLGQSTAGAD